MTEQEPAGQDIAVVGIACRLPGAEDHAAYWALLRGGVDAVTAPPPGRPAARPSGRAGFLSHVDGFEPEFFGLSPREARTMDPHQRLALELGWEGLEDAGIVPASVRGARVAVHLGLSGDEWAGVLRGAGEPAGLHTYTGTQRGMVAARLSHFLGTTGPSLTVDTGQSSSLTAVHLACESLRTGQADLALAGGVSLMLDDGADQDVSAIGALSPDGRCYTFDDRANGFVRGEGGGLVVLKRLGAALADGDRIHAVVRGSAVNHDGGAGALTVPDAVAQEALIRTALTAAATEPGDVGYVELHGTGTRAGDPVEAAALGAVFGRGDGGALLRVGSVKTNIGHLEAAAGIAGLLKAVLAVRHGHLPPGLNFAAPHPSIPLARLGLQVQTRDERWPSVAPRVAGVSSFGMGGANCHVVVAEAPPAERRNHTASETGSPERAVPWLLSAGDFEGLRAAAAALRDRVTALGAAASAEDIAATLAHRRTHFAVRCAVLASRPADFVPLLDAVAAAADPAGSVRTAGAAPDPALLALVRRHVQGETVDWSHLLPVSRPVADLPAHPFRRRPLWPGRAASAPDAPESAPDGARALDAAEDAPAPRPTRQAPRGGATPAWDEVVRQVTMAVLELDDDGRLFDDDIPFKDLGSDSFTALELTDSLERATGLDLPSSLVYDHPTPRAVAAHLAQMAERAMDSAQRQPGPSTSAEDDRPAAGPSVPAEDPVADDPVALVGIGCRFPGGIRSAEDLWGVVAEERDVLGDFPDDRGWDLGRLFSDAPGARGTSGTRTGGFLYDATEFDAAFFGISPREAQSMDPQQRLLLEVGWEAVEDAGVDPLALRATPTGVFVGVIPQQYDTLVQRSGEDLDGYVYTGSTTSVLAGRLAYTLGLEGPALAVDTACSSSLTALHLAVRSLRSGECSLALAGGVTVMSTPTMFTDFTAQGALSGDGRSKAFGAGADGTGWSEGVAVVVLERLSDARSNGHSVLAVVRGTALNEDGASNGLTAPNGPAQQRVVRAALADASLAPGDVDVVEAHGPGTRLGDPIEVNALLATYGAARSQDRPLWLGSVKSNLGHTQAAAGMAGVVKMVMAMRDGVLPRTLHADELSPHIDWSSGTVRVLSAARTWPDSGRPRRAGVSAFGAGGTNAHVILEAPAAGEAAARQSAQGVAQEGEVRPARGDAEAAAPDAGAPFALPLAAKTDASLAAAAGRLRDHLHARPGLDLRDVTRTLARRSPFARRAVAVGPDRDAVLAELDALARDPAAVPPPDTHKDGGGAVFVFPGQGSQWPGMAAGLLDHDAVFTAVARDCDAAFARHTGWSVLDVLRQVPGAPDLDRVDVTQPALFTVMVALAATWQAHGVRPAAVVGHSQGEIAAAHVAGALSLDDAARIVALRSRALLDLSGRGAMAALSLPAAAAKERLRPFSPELDVAAVNGPSSTTVGGDPETLDRFLAVLEADGVRFRRLPVSNAGHSSQVDPLREHLLDVLGPVAPRSGSVPFYSTVAGEQIDTAGLDTHYWWRNARQPVLFEPAVRALLAAGHRTFIEVNPHPLLHAALQETFEDGDVAAHTLGTLRRNDDPALAFVRSLAEAYRHGCTVDWTAGATGGGLVPLPSYAFTPRRYWCLPAPQEPADVAPGTGRHPLAATSTPLPATGGLLVGGRLRVRDQPWLLDHALHGESLVPGTLFAELAWAAAREAGAGRIDDLTLVAPLPLSSPDDVSDLGVTVDAPGADGVRAFTIHARPHSAGPDAPWTVHALGTLDAAARQAQSQNQDAAAWPPQGVAPIELGDAYERLRAEGYTYGPAFRGLDRLWRRDGAVFAEVALPAEAATGSGGFAVHPALFDMALHALLLTAPDTRARMPFSWRGLTLGAGDATRLRVHITPLGGDAYRLRADDPEGRLVVDVEAVTFRPAPVAAAPGQLAELTWSPVVLHATGDDLTSIAVVGPAHPGLPAAPAHPDVEALAQANAAGAPPPRIVVVHEQTPPATEADLPRVLHATTAWHLVTLQRLLGSTPLAEARIVLATHRATGPDPDLVAAAVTGLWRSAAAEHPDRVGLVDSDDTPPSTALACAAVAAGRRQLALRDGLAHAPELAPLGAEDVLMPPAGESAWKLALTGPRNTTTPDRLALVPAPEHARPLELGQVRVAVRASGLNFVDVITTMGLFPGTAALGREFAGVVTEVADDVAGPAVGDRVMGIVPLTSAAVAPVVVTDHRLVAPTPDGWTHAQAAGVPIAFLTAYYGLVTLGGLAKGHSVLVHAATGGVGTAALQIARHLGAEVYATAHPDKWPTLRAAGVPEERIASSRSLDFEARIATATGGRGVDIVLNALTGPFNDASLRLLSPGGLFLEMGKLDIRTAEQIGAVRDDVAYRPFDILSVDPDTIAALYRDLAVLFADGALTPVPHTTWHVARAREALRHFRDARHTGRLVLEIPVPLDPGGTVLVTGGTGTLGTLLARHLVHRHGARHLLLAGRGAAGAERAARLAAELAPFGVHITHHAGDLADPDEVDRLLGAVPAGHPLTAVVHAAGVLDDATVTTLTVDRLAPVLAAKAAAAWHLHVRTRTADLAGFTLYSSVAGTLGLPGQANYAAANAFLDALAGHRAARGARALSVAWGLWQEPSAMSRHLSARDVARMAETGLAPLATTEALALLDTALARPETAVVATGAAGRATGVAGHAAGRPAGGIAHTGRADAARLPASEADTERTAAPGRPAAPVAAEDGTVRGRLARLPAARRTSGATAWIQEQAAAVLRLDDPQEARAAGAFRDLGFDSLTSVELRNRINAATGLRLPVTSVFDHPTPGELAAHVVSLIFPQDAAGAEDERVEDDTAAEEGSTDGVSATSGPAGAQPPGAGGDDVDAFLRSIDEEFGFGAAGPGTDQDPGGSRSATEDRS